MADNKLDFLKTNDFKNKPDVIITNPPFNICKEIIIKSLETVKQDGLVIMLLRLNYFGSKDRKEFWNKNMATACIVHHKRISFTENKKTDSIEYMHCIWKKGYNPDHCKLYLV